ncbi:MAG: hypothetical protein K8J31_11510 [Anaerolineae bacterium]|nr:hypothetical protein [Anaerolineae bacterium]
MKWLLALLLVAVCVVGFSPVMAQEMMCPGHEGNTIASLAECVSHAASEGHITNAGIAKSLLAKLNAAQSALDRGQPSVAINTLEAFIREVQAQAGKHIHLEHAGHMVEHARRVIAALG